jgi:hypothetical protein
MARPTAEEIKLTKLIKSTMTSAVLVAAVVAGGAQDVGAQQGVFAYPMGGQSQQQQQGDHNECYQWAVQQSGFNPSAPAPHVAQPNMPPPQSGGMFGRGSYGQGGGVADAGKGAALGAIGGAIAGDAGQGAAIGAASGVLFGGLRRSRKERERQQWYEQQQMQAQQQQQQVAQQRAQQMQLYNRAYGACMSSRDYQVR